MPGRRIFLRESQAKLLFSKGMIYILRRLNKHTGVMNLQLENMKRAAKVLVSRVGHLVSENGEIFVVDERGARIPLSFFVKDTEFKTVEEWINHYKEQFSTKSIWGAGLYRVELIKILNKI